jgi:hypothetical protein
MIKYVVVFRIPSIEHSPSLGEYILFYYILLFLYSF